MSSEYKFKECFTQVIQNVICFMPLRVHLILERALQTDYILV